MNAKKERFFYYLERIGEWKTRVMNIGILGSGYVGTVTGAGLADLGNEVTFVDFDEERVEALNGAKSPIFEPGLDELLA